MKYQAILSLKRKGSRKMAATLVLIDLDPSKQLYSVHSFCLGVTANDKISFLKFKV